MKKIGFFKRLKFFLLAIILMFSLLSCNSSNGFSTIETAIKVCEKDNDLIVWDVVQHAPLCQAYYSLGNGVWHDAILEERENGWYVVPGEKIGMRQIKVSQSGCTVFFQAYREIYYVQIVSMEGDTNKKISDNLNNNFHLFSTPQGVTVNYWFAFIGNKPNNYSVTIDGETIQLI